MAENLFKQADIKVGIYLTTNGAYSQWKPDSRCIEIPVAANTTYYFRYGDRSCSFSQIIFLKSDGTTENYSNLGIITTRSDTAALRITFADELIEDIANLDYSRFILSTDPFVDISPIPAGPLLMGYYPTGSNRIIPKNAAYRCFAIFCQPGHVYKVQNNGVDIPVFGLNQYDSTGAYLSRVTTASTTTAAETAAVIGVVMETSQLSDLSGIRVLDTSGGTPEPELKFGRPYYSRTLKVGNPADGSVLLPFEHAPSDGGYEMELTLTGNAAAGLTTPVIVSGTYSATSGNIEFTLTGTPSAAGSIAAEITGGGLTTPITFQITVVDKDAPPVTENYHYVTLPCTEATTYHFRYDGAYSPYAVFSYFNGSNFLRRESNMSVITTPTGCDTLGINLPDSVYTDYSKITLTEGTTGEYKSLVQLTQDVAVLQEGSGGSTPVEPEPTVPYYDINFYLFGDSITASNITRWVPTFMSLVTFKHIENYAVGGANYTCSANVVEDLSGIQQGSSNKIWNQLNRLKAKVAAGESPVPDVIVILAGINDRYSQLGDPEAAFDYTVDYSAIQVTDPLTHNLAGAFRFTLEAIMNEWPDVRVIIATPLPVGASTREKLKAENATVEAITKTLTACARKMALPVINQAYECGISPYRELGGEYLHYNSDGLHPNQHGGEKIGKYLARRITGLL